jgi:sulfur relay protein TusB/DsrH
MEPILFLVNSAPSSPNVERAFHTAFTLREQGHAVSIFLIQDGVLGGLASEGDDGHSHVAQALDAGIAVQVLGEDLALRGFTAARLRNGVGVADYSQLIDLFDQHRRVIGAL